MKICLLANPRTGSTSLYGLIKSHLSLDYHSVSEPFNPNYMKYNLDDHNHLIDIESLDNVFFKHICCQYPEKYENRETWYKWLFNNFDKVVLLDRKDRVAQSESFVFQETKNRASWHIRSYYDLTNIDKSKIDRRIEILEQDGQFLLENTNKFPLFYYEDLFVDKNIEKINELFQYLNLSPIQKHINTFIYSETKKVRIFIEKRTLL